MDDEESEDVKARFEYEWRRLSSIASAAQKVPSRYLPGMLLFWPKEKHPVVYDPGTFEPRHIGPDEYFLVLESRVPFEGTKVLQLRTGKFIYLADIQLDTMTIVDEPPKELGNLETHSTIETLKSGSD